MTKPKSHDVAVIGAGVFGAWTAYYLRKSGATVTLCGCLRSRQLPRQFRRRIAHHPHGLWLR